MWTAKYFRGAMNVSTDVIRIFHAWHLDGKNHGILVLTIAGIQYAVTCVGAVNASTDVPVHHLEGNLVLKIAGIQYAVTCVLLITKDKMH